MSFVSDIKRFVKHIFAPADALRSRYRRFKGLLEADDRALERMADLQETFYGVRPADRARVRKLIREMEEAVSDMRAHLRAMRPLRHQGLDRRMEIICGDVGRLIRAAPEDTSPPYVISLPQAAGNPSLAGGKAANLGAVAQETDLRVPPGLVVTTRAFNLFVERSGLRSKLDSQLADALLCKHSDFSKRCDKMRELILCSRIPSAITSAMSEGIRALGEEHGRKAYALAVRSSAWAEDGEFSFAGQYESVLGVDPEHAERAWLEVLASKYSPRAVTYRILRGLSDEETPMAVLILPMLEPVAAGVAYSLDADPGASEGVVSVHAVPGLGSALVDGADSGEVIQLSRADRPEALSVPDEPRVLSDAQAAGIAKVALELEEVMGSPQDVEWCLDREGAVHVVQSRPFHGQPLDAARPAPDFDPGVRPLISDMEPVSVGAGSGRILHLHDAQDPAEAPRGSVVVFETLAPNLTRCLDRVEAVIGTSGGRAGHFATVAREFGIPVVVGRALDVADLEDGQLVTVDGFKGRVYPGRLKSLVENAEAVRKEARTGALHKYDDLVPLVTTLNLTDPESADFTPGGCRSLHDLIRYIHETGVREMFDLVGKSGRGMSLSRKLATDLPLTLYVLPLDSEFAGGRKDEVRPEEVRSLPMRQVWQGLGAEEARWEAGLHHMDWEELDRVSAGIFSKEARFLSSYALVAEDYVHLMIRFGYHFSELDSVCGQEDKNNYARFRFKGGGADFDGRLLRLGFIERVLRAGGFEVSVKSDMLDAMLARKDRETTGRGLDLLGRVMAKTRLMDMSLTGPDQVEKMAEEYIEKLAATRTRELERKKMGGFPLTWVADNLAVGPAPMSYDMLDKLRAEGVSAVLNLCQEFPDLPDIERGHGFEVYYLPVPDEEAPGLEEMEKALAWLDEAVYLGKKTLIHCRHGIGRTGTVLNAYLLRRGMGHKGASRILKKLRSKPESFDQWWSLRKYGQTSGRLTIREPSLESSNQVDLSPFFLDYEELVGRAEELMAKHGAGARCGRDNDRCCRTPVSLTMVEAVYLSNKINVLLNSQDRLALIERAAEVAATERQAAAELDDKEFCLADSGSSCPLWEDGGCMLYDHRPFQCRLFELDPAEAHVFWEATLAPALDRLTTQIYFAFMSRFPGGMITKFSLPDVVSGRYVQTFFHIAASSE